MKNKILAIICTILVCLPLITKATSFYAIFDEKSFIEYINKENITKENFLNLPSEKLVEDFEYYFKTMKENSPLFNATKRHVLDLEKQFKDYKKKISESKSNFEQLSLIDEFSRKFLGHNGIILGDCSYYINFYNSWDGDVRKVWAKILTDDPLTQRNTDLYNCFKWKKERPELQDSTPKKSNENIETKIIDPEKIAYIKVKSFENENIGPHDEKIIGEFFEKTKYFDNIIIDITGNFGGSTNYSYYFAPILKHDLIYNQYTLFKMGPQSTSYVETGYEGKIQPIDELPDFPNLNPEDIKELTHFIKHSYHYKPLKNSVNAKIWLLIDEEVFSASEYFAILCKQGKTGTIVGRNSRGDGIGIDPVYLVLPNSKVALRYSVDYGLNEDGSCNAEFGTKPDIVSPDGEDPLTTCLKAIKANQN